MFIIGNRYTKKDIYSILNVPPERQRGAWDTGGREYDGDIFIFTNVGIPGRTGHDYNNFWDGEFFHWEGTRNSNVSNSLISKILHPIDSQKNFLFIRTNDIDPYTFEGGMTAKSHEGNNPIKIVFQFSEEYYFPLEGEEPTQTNPSISLTEGSKKQITVNKYERNPLARRLCIEHYGVFCQICNFDFLKKYGEIGKDFIHVHHIIPLSEIGPSYEVNPIHDLIPVCPNCHSMIHRKKEVLSVERLKEMVCE